MLFFFSSFNVLQNEIGENEKCQPDKDTINSQDTYEAAIENYKSRVMKVAGTNSHLEGSTIKIIPGREGSSIENSLSEIKINMKNESCEKESKSKKDQPSINIAKKRQLFEKVEISDIPKKSPSAEIFQRQIVKKRTSDLELGLYEYDEKRKSTLNVEMNLSGVKDRFLILEKNVNSEPIEKSNTVEVHLSATLKDRLSSLQSCFDLTKNAKALVKGNKEKNGTLNNRYGPERTNLNHDEIGLKGIDVSPFKKSLESIDFDREDSGIHTTDVSCSVSQADDQHEERFAELISVLSVTNNHSKETAKSYDISNQQENTTREQKLEEQSEVYNNIFVESQQKTTFSMPDLIQHNSIAVESEKQKQVQHQDENVSLSDPAVDVKYLIVNLASHTISDKVEENSIYSNGFLMLGETNKNDDTSFIVSSLNSYYQQENETSNITTVP